MPNPMSPSEPDRETLEAQTPDLAASAATDFAEVASSQRRGMSLAIGAQIFGMLGDIAFRNGILLVYFTALELGSNRVLLYLSLPPLLMLVLRLPAAHLADHIGLKRVGAPGFALIAVGFSLFLAAGFVERSGAEALVLSGVLLHGAGQAIASAGFMPLLRRIVPQKLRGRFFGRLHVSWQAVGLVFVAGCALLLPAEASVRMYQMIVAVLVAGGAMRVLLFLRIAEPPRPARPTHGFFSSISRTLHAEGYAPFSAYIFLLALCTGATPFVFGLLEKHTLHFGDDQVVWMGHLIMIGSLIGFALGGKATDWWGTKPVFLVCHFGYGVALALMLGRAFLPVDVIYLAGAANLLYGAFWAGSLIAITTELLALVPRENQAMGTSLALLLFHIGGAASGMLGSAALGMGIFSSRWELMGMALGPYDSLLLLWAVMIVLLVVTLGLVPSVLRKAEWMPST
ncbi:MAG: MFS transporter [Phycisphaeraceae bacterium]